jgi:hypothetical protein
LDTSDSRSEIPERVWNVLLRKAGEDQLDRSCEKWRSSVKTWRSGVKKLRCGVKKWRSGVKNQGAEEYPTYTYSKKEGKLTAFVTSCVETVCKTVYRTEGRRIEVMGRGGSRRKQPLEVLKEKKGYRKLKEEALDRTLRRTGLGRGCERLQTDCGMNECITILWVRLSFENACNLSAQTVRSITGFCCKWDEQISD